MVVLVGATISLAAVGMGYGLWSQTLTITGQVDTGTVALTFLDLPHSGPPVSTTLKTTPYSDDDHYVNSANDPGDTGVCALPVIDDDDDGQEGEDPIGGGDEDGDTLIDEDPPGKKSTCDPRRVAVWTTAPLDEDGDGFADEDPADGIDNDTTTDGRIDEDGIGGWVTPFAVAAVGQDIGKTEVIVVNSGKLLIVTMSNPSVSLGNVVYSPTVWAQVQNSGSIPVEVVAVNLTLTPAYTLWDRDGDNVISPNTGNPDDCETGDECAAPLVYTLTGIEVGDVLDALEIKEIKLELSMTPAAVPLGVYGLLIAITANQYNEAP